MMNIAIFSTGRDQEAIDLFLLIKQIENINIIYVFSNREEGEAEITDRFFQVVKAANIKLVSFSSGTFAQELFHKDRETWRKLYHAEVMKLIEPFHKTYAIELIVLVGYMLIVSEELTDKYNMINLHPALPGSYVGKWEDVINNVIKNKDTEYGCMMHIVTKELDRGPAVCYYKFSLLDEELKQLWEKEEKNFLFKKIREKELKYEFPLVKNTLTALSRGEIIIKDKKVYKLCPDGVELKEI